MKCSWFFFYQQLAIIKCPVVFSVQFVRDVWKCKSSRGISFFLSFWIFQVFASGKKSSPFTLYYNAMYRYYYLDESSSNAIFIFLPLPFVYYVLKSLIHFWLLFVVCFCGTKRPRPVVEQQFFVYCIAQVKKKCNGSIIRFVCILYTYINVLVRLR